MTDGGDRRLSEDAQDLDDHLRGVASDLGLPGIKKKRRPWKVTFLFLIFLMAAIGVLFAVIFQPDLFKSQSEPLDVSGTESTVTDQGAASSESASDTEGSASDAEGSIGGTWTMYSTNSRGDERPVFTLRFTGTDRGEVEILNDDTEFDNHFRLDGDLVWFTFTRVFDIETDNLGIVKWPEISVFTGEFTGVDRISGEWAREAWECLPDRDPPCVVKLDAIGDPSYLVREP